MLRAVCCVRGRLCTAIPDADYMTGSAGMSHAVDTTAAAASSVQSKKRQETQVCRQTVVLGDCLYQLNAHTQHTYTCQRRGAALFVLWRTIPHPLSVASAYSRECLEAGVSVAAVGPVIFDSSDLVSFMWVCGSVLA